MDPAKYIPRIKKCNQTSLYWKLMTQLYNSLILCSSSSVMSSLLHPCPHAGPRVDAGHAFYKVFIKFQNSLKQQIVAYLWSVVAPQQESQTGMHLQGSPLASRGRQKQHCPLVHSEQGYTLQSDSSPIRPEFYNFTIFLRSPHNVLKTFIISNCGAYLISVTMDDDIGIIEPRFEARRPMFQSLQSCLLLLPLVPPAPVQNKRE